MPRPMAKPSLGEVREMAKPFSGLSVNAVGECRNVQCSLLSLDNGLKPVLLQRLFLQRLASLAPLFSCME